jgi:hypothetical protein
LHLFWTCFPKRHPIVAQPPLTDFAKSVLLVLPIKWSNTLGIQHDSPALAASPYPLTQRRFFFGETLWAGLETFTLMSLGRPEMKS